MIDAVLFLSTLVAIGVVAYWVFRHDGTPDEAPPGGILGMRGERNEADGKRRRPPQAGRPPGRFRPRYRANAAQTQHEGRPEGRD
jgi:hypothetical protein